MPLSQDDILMNKPVGCLGTKRNAEWRTGSYFSSLIAICLFLYGHFVGVLTVY